MIVAVSVEPRFSKEEMLTIRPRPVRRIESRYGQVLVSYDALISRAFEQEAVGRLVSVLKNVVGYGTGSRAKLSGYQVAGKTGTADKARDI